MSRWANLFVREDYVLFVCAGFTGRSPLRSTSVDPQIRVAQGGQILILYDPSGATRAQVVHQASNVY